MNDPRIPKPGPRSTRPPRKFTRARWLILIGVVAAAAVGFAVLPAFRHGVGRRKEEKRLDRARGFFKSGELKRAFLDAKSALDADPQSIEANRLIAQVIEASGEKGALNWRLRLRSLTADDPENLIALAKDAIEASEPGKAADALGALKPEHRTGALFHEVSALLAEATGDTAGAEAHWQQASAADPASTHYRVRLAAVQLKSKDPATRTTALQSLDAITDGTSGALAAIRVLLADARGYDHPVRIRRLAEKLGAAPGATLTDRLTRLSALLQVGATETHGEITTLLASAGDRPADLYQILLWMSDHDLALLAADWLKRQPAEDLSRPPACIAVAQIHVKTFAWKALQEFTDAASWGDLDYLRRAYSAQALEHLDDPAASEQEWKNAVAAARTANSPERLERLALLAQSWRWQARLEELCWELGKNPHAPKWPLDVLWAKAAAKLDASLLQQVAGLIMKADPQSVSARNNYLFLSLLTRSDEGNPHQSVRRLHEENPGNSPVAVTHALSLYLQNHPQEALDTLAGLTDAELHNPDAGFAFYKGLFLIACDRAPEAEPYLQLASGRIALDEEKSLLTREKAAAKARAEEAAKKSALNRTQAQQGN